jgi:RNA polymerase sigma-70 factor (ECF subfamily)
MTETAERFYEELLVVRCQAGDPAALAEIVARFDGRLRYYLRRLLGDALQSGVDDVLQEVWIDVWRGVGRLAQPAAFATWLYTITRRRALAFAGRRQPTTSLADNDGVVDVPEADAESDAFGADDAARIHAGLSRLAPRHREALVLRYMEGMSYEEIASVVGCGVGTVRSRIHYAKRELRRIWNQSQTDGGT